MFKDEVDVYSDLSLIWNDLNRIIIFFTKMTYGYQQILTYESAGFSPNHDL